MKRTLYISLTMVFTLACQGVMGGSVNAITKSSDTTIAFVSLDSNLDIYTMSMDGGNLQQLTNTSTELLQGATEPKWSSNKKQISYLTGGSIPYLMNADGSDQRPLTTLIPTTCENGQGNCTGYKAEWAPNDLSMAVWDIDSFYIINTDDGKIIYQTSALNQDHYSLAAWHPDGEQIVIATNNSTSTSKISVLDINSNIVLNTAKTGDVITSLSISPDGEKLAFSINCGYDCGSSLFVMNIDNLQANQLIDYKVSNSYEVIDWSSENYILFLRRDSSLGILDNTIMQINYDGTGITELFDPLDVSSNIILSMDRKSLLYSSSLFGETHITIQNLDGTDSISLQEGFNPDW